MRSKFCSIFDRMFWRQGASKLEDQCQIEFCRKFGQQVRTKFKPDEMLQVQ